MDNAFSQFARFKVLFAGVSSLILVMGIARFSYTSLLPSMEQQAGLSSVGAGWLAAINYVGYLCGVFIAAKISDTQLKTRLYRYGLLIAVVSTALMGISTHFNIWLISRFIAGLSSAAGLMLGSGLILNWLMRHGHRSELGIHFSGVSLGMALCSAVAIFMQQQYAWNMQWYVLSAIGCLLLIPAFFWFPASETSNSVSTTQSRMHSRPPSAKLMRLLIGAYCCAGFGYVVTATFMVAIVDELPGLNHMGNWMFLLAGLIGAPSCIIWDLIARRIGDVNALIGAGLIQVVGIIMPTLGLGLIGSIIGAVFYGATCIGIVSLVLTMAGRYYPSQPAKMMGKMTIAYGVAQIVGPAITGSLSDYYGGYSIGLYLAAVIMSIGCLLFFMMKKCTH